MNQRVRSSVDGTYWRLPMHARPPCQPVKPESSPAFYRAAFERMTGRRALPAQHPLGCTPRSGHPEGSIAAHIADLERNAAVLDGRSFPRRDRWRLRLLVHSHDTFKPERRGREDFADPRSHASLARAFLAEFCPGDDGRVARHRAVPRRALRALAAGTARAARTTRGRTRFSRRDPGLESVPGVPRSWTAARTGKSRDPLRLVFRGNGPARDQASNVTAGDILASVRLPECAP